MASLLLFIRAFVKGGKESLEICATKSPDENTIEKGHKYGEYRRNMHFRQPVFSSSITFRDIQNEQAWNIDELCI